jgi:hypothetical protein
MTSVLQREGTADGQRGAAASWSVRPCAAGLVCRQLSTVYPPAQDTSPIHSGPCEADVRGAAAAVSQDVGGSRRRSLCPARWLLPVAAFRSMRQGLSLRANVEPVPNLPCPAASLCPPHTPTRAALNHSSPLHAPSLPSRSSISPSPLFLHLSAAPLRTDHLPHHSRRRHHL